MILSARVMDSYLTEEYFIEEEVDFGTIHSVYRSLLNISTVKGEIISLSHFNGVYMPLTIQINEEPDFLEEEGLQGSKVSFEGGRLQIKDHYTILLEGAFKQVRKQKAITVTENLITSVQQAKGDLLHLGKRGGCISYYADYEDGDLLERELKERISQLNVSFQFERILGLGRGLTPSGDDFCLGILCGAHYLKEERLSYMRGELKGAIEKGVRNTTDISAQMLLNGIAGRFNEPLLDLSEAILAGDSPDVCKGLMIKLLNIGSTSGADMAVGLLYAMEMVTGRY